jgi:hypothetical protein
MTYHQRVHGSISSTNYENIAEAFAVYTLIDITATGIVAPYNSALKQVIDDSDTIINSESSWIKSRNKQRNWETLVQVLGLRSLPNIQYTPVCKCESLGNFDFGSNYIGKENVWCFEFTTEQQHLFTIGDNPTSLLLQDLHQVPVITNLDETVDISPGIINTLDSKWRNICVYYLSDRQR